jgi:hypothetical protein
MKIVNSPIRYRVGSNRINLRVNLKVIMAAFGVVLALSILYIVLINKKTDQDATLGNGRQSPVDDKMFGNKILYEPFNDGISRAYDSIYPLSQPEVNSKDKTKTYRIIAIADLDTSSKTSPDSSKFISYLLNGKLTIADDLNSASVEFDSTPVEISSEYAYGDRGMELSELVIFNGKLYSCDDRTGIIYEILPEKRLAIPWVVLVDGDGRNTSKGNTNSYLFSKIL